MKKYLFSITISVVTIIALIQAAPAKASSKMPQSQRDAVDWVLSLADSNWGSEGNEVNYDGSEWAVGDFGEPQCVDLVKAYSDHLGKDHSYMNGVNASAFGNLSLPEGWAYTHSPQPGDIFVKTSGQFGHVGIVTEIDGDQYYWVDTNGGGIAGYDALGRRLNECATRRGPEPISYVSTFIHPPTAGVFTSEAMGRSLISRGVHLTCTPYRWGVRFQGQGCASDLHPLPLGCAFPRARVCI